MNGWKVLRFQLLADADYSLRVEFVHRMLDATQNDWQFPATVLVSDKAHSAREGVVSIDNAHTWSFENPIALSPRKCNFSINIWAEILGDHLLGPYILLERFSGVKYLVYCSMSSRSYCQEYRSLFARIYGSCTMVHQNIFQLWCVTTVRCYISQDVDWTRRTCCLASPLPGPQFFRFFPKNCLLSSNFRWPQMKKIQGISKKSKGNIPSTPGMFKHVR